jgi:GT2 family glycosyltransferase
MTSQAAIITAVIVLYERAPEESEALASFQRILAADPAIEARFRIILYDNSPAAHAVSAVSALSYVHDAANGGLAAAYNHGLDQASAKNSEWLLLLDQDTTLTFEYVENLLGEIDKYSSQINVAAIVPFIEQNGRIHSPEADFFYHLRHQFPHARLYPLSRDASGIQSEPLNAYNSGAAIRVSALRQIGGFPSDFRLDYLDHAVFRELHQLGFSFCVLNAALQQKLSHDDLNTVSMSRHTSVLKSQSLFVARYGTWLDRQLYRLWLLRKSRYYRSVCEDRRVWRGMVRQALGKWSFPPQARAQ